MYKNRGLALVLILIVVFFGFVILKNVPMKEGGLLKNLEVRLEQRANELRKIKIKVDFPEPTIEEIKLSDRDFRAHERSSFLAETVFINGEERHTGEFIGLSPIGYYKYSFVVPADLMPIGKVQLVGFPGAVDRIEPTEHPDYPEIKEITVIEVPYKDSYILLLIPTKYMPMGATEGMYLDITITKELNEELHEDLYRFDIKTNPEETAKARERIKALQEKLLRRTKEREQQK